MSKQTDAAKEKGRIAYLEGKTFKDCPYWDHRTVNGKVTFSRSYRKAWFDGFKQAQKDEVNLDN